LPDSQAGHFCDFELRTFLGSKDNQCDSSRQRKSTKNRRNGNSLMFVCCSMDRPDIQNLFLVRVRESLIGEGQGPKNDKKNSNPNDRFHTFHLQATFPSMRLEPARLQEVSRHPVSLHVGLGRDGLPSRVEACAKVFFASSYENILDAAR
jgi:hypothetical protein